MIDGGDLIEFLIRLQTQRHQEVISLSQRSVELSDVFGVAARANRERERERRKRQRIEIDRR